VITTDTPLSKLDISVRLQKALHECLASRKEPLTYGAALKLGDREVRAQYQVGQSTMSEWAAFRRDNPVPPTVSSLLAGNTLTEDTPKADSAKMLRYRYEQLAETYHRLANDHGKLESALRSERMAHAALREEMRRMTERLTVGVLRRAGVAVRIDWPDTFEDED
jgi:hypothetical protein